MTNQLSLHDDLETAHVFSADELVANIRDRRAVALSLFADLDQDAREALIHDAWAVGLRALANANAAAQEAKLKDVGNSLVQDLTQRLDAHVESQQRAMTTVMARYFDPAEGQVSQRLAAFVDDHGVLARQLERFMGPKSSVLAETLAKQLGESSPLFKRLSPTDSEGLLKLLEGQLRSVLDQSQAALARALDPLAEDSALARMLRSLRDELEEAATDREKQLATALAALNANDEGSLLSRMMRETTRARHDVLAAVNPEAPNSPMGILKATLTKLLQDQAASQGELAKRQEERQTQFENHVRETLARLETKRAHDLKAPRGGLDFEDSVVDFLRRATAGAPCIIEGIGSTPGTSGRCKKGDAVLRFTAESAFADAGVVFEAKRDASYGVQKALSELDVARKNRKALAGVFVMARSHAPEGFPPFARYGSNVVVTWDDSDPSTNSYLQAAILLGMGLVTRSRPAGDPGDMQALRDIESRIETELGRLDKIEKSSTTIRNSVNNIEEEVGRARKGLDLLLRKAQSTLRALNIELSDEAVEKASPIALPRISFDAAMRALPADTQVAEEPVV